MLEGRLGSARADEGAARLSLGCYEVFGGDVASPGARRLVSSAARPRELVYGNDPDWRRLIAEVHGSAVFDRPMQTFDPGGLDAAALARCAKTLPSELALRPLDAPILAQLGHELEPHGLQVFDSPESLARERLAYGALSGAVLACAATAYTVSSRYVEIAIATRPAFRGRGLAAAVSAALLLECLRRGLVPCWSASNPVSQRLAARLGFRPAGTCEVLYLRT